MAIKLLVEDFEDVVVAEDDVEAATGEQLFKTMNSLCRFELWARADVFTGRRTYQVSDDRYGTANREDAKKLLQAIMVQVGASGFLLQVQKKEDEQIDGPEGTYAPENVGLRPLPGPRGDGLETPAGPEATLARIRGTLARV